ncbi:MAG: hypothetical protein ACK5H4_25525 [Lacrimispora sphenoides]
MNFLCAVSIGIISFIAGFFLSAFSTGWGCSGSISIIGIAIIYVLLEIRNCISRRYTFPQDLQNKSSQLSNDPPEVQE